jgi:hypothetical protein
MKKRILLATVILVVVIVAVVTLFVFTQFRPTHFYPVANGGSISLTLTDSDTQKPIGKVNGEYVRVLLGGVDAGYLNDNGALEIDGVPEGSQELTLIIPHYGQKRQDLEVKSNENTPIKTVIDMPNPIFDVTVNCTTGWLFEQYGEITVSLTNRGDIASDNTRVLILVYNEHDPSTPEATHTFAFPSLVPEKDGGKSYTSETWRCNDFRYSSKEIIVAIVLEGWGYTPQNKQAVNDASVPTSLFTQISDSIAKYLSDNPDVIVGTVCKVAVGWFESTTDNLPLGWS